MRRVLRNTTAPIFSNFNRIVPACARASSVPASPNVRNRSSSTCAKLESNKRNWLARQPWQLVRSANNPNCCSLIQLAHQRQPAVAGRVATGKTGGDRALFYGWKLKQFRVASRARRNGGFRIHSPQQTLGRSSCYDFFV
jgi:hypothetical protein